MDGERTKLVVAGVLILVAVGLFFVLGRDPNRLPTNFNFICVETGERFNFSKSEIRQLPEVNPNTGEATLLPVSESDGKLVIDSHYAGALRGDLKDKNKFVDFETLEILNVDD